MTAKTQIRCRLGFALIKFRLFSENNAQTILAIKPSIKKLVSHPKIKNSDAMFHANAVGNTPGVPRRRS